MLSLSSFLKMCLQTTPLKGGHMNSITQLLDLEDSDIVISETRIEGSRKTITLETHPDAHFCPQCGFGVQAQGTFQGRIRIIPGTQAAALEMH